jgi:hypothetical protein
MLLVGLLQVIATVLVLAYPIGMLVLGGEMLRPGPHSSEELCNVLLFTMYPVVYGAVLSPAGVLLHLIIARTTKTYARWAWGVMFLGSLLMCSAFPAGTISGGIILYFLVSSDTFVKMRRGGDRPPNNQSQP